MTFSSPNLTLTVDMKKEEKRSLSCLSGFEELELSRGIGFRPEGAVRWKMSREFESRSYSLRFVHHFLTVFYLLNQLVIGYMLMRRGAFRELKITQNEAALIKGPYGII